MAGLTLSPCRKVYAITHEQSEANNQSGHRVANDHEGSAAGDIEGHRVLRSGLGGRLRQHRQKLEAQNPPNSGHTARSGLNRQVPFHPKFKVAGLRQKRRKSPNSAGGRRRNDSSRSGRTA